MKTKEKKQGAAVAGHRAAVYKTVEECVEETIRRVGKNIMLGMPIGAGKPTIIANEFYRRAKEDPGLNLKLMSGLTLETPKAKSDLEKRFIEPLVKRIFEDYPDPQYVADMRANKLPPNVDLVEFFLVPGGYLNVPNIQQNYISSNYTHVARDVMDMGLNVAASMIAKKTIGGEQKYSLGSNADAPADMITKLAQMREQGKPIAVLGQVNSNMPFMYGAALSGPEVYDGIIDSRDYYHKMFGPPREPVSDVDFLIGLYAGALFKDGGTIQIGIGTLGDAIAYALSMRHNNNQDFRDLMAQLGAHGKFGEAIDRIGGFGTFDRGLYGCTEMITDAFIQLINAGVIKRKVYDDYYLQKLINEGKITEKVTGETLDLLLETGAINERLTHKDVEFLTKFGILKPGILFDKGMISLNGTSVKADLRVGKNRDAIEKNLLGDRLQNGLLAHASFFIGPNSFYQTLNDMSEEERRRIQMREISFCNQIYGQEEMKRVQRIEGRFANTAIMATLMGAAVSDGLENGQVISGVGGQYNFVAMGHALEDGRSIILLRSTKDVGGELMSNIVWNYGHTTIPRHLRDIFITEYGIASVRGRTDKDVIKSMINIADSRYQTALLKKAKEAGKIPADYKIPDAFKNNYPERIAGDLSVFKEKGYFDSFPYGTDLTDEELVLGKALRGLKSALSTKRFKLPSFAGAAKIFSPPASAMPYLERMKLDKPASTSEKFMQKLVIYALTTSGAV